MSDKPTKSTKSKSSKKPTVAELQAALAAAEASADALRAAVETQSAAAAAHQARLARSVPEHRTPFGELMVGIRNISDTPVGIQPQFKGDPSVNLNHDHGVDDPAQVQIISYTWWRELRKSTLVAKGFIMRDDSVLGDHYAKAPADQPGEVAPDHVFNAVVNPQEWVNSRDETELRAGIEKMTSEDSLRRVRRVVDDFLRAEENKYPRSTIEEQQVAAAKAIKALPGKLRLVDELVSDRLEGSTPPEPSKIKIV